MAEKAFNYQQIAKLNRRNTEQARAKIQVAKIVERLQQFVNGELELDGSQVRTAEILLNKTLPALTASELTAVVEDKRSATQETLEGIVGLLAKSKDPSITVQ